MAEHAPSLRLCSQLGVRAVNVEQYMRGDGIRGLFTTSPRRRDQCVMALPFSSVLSPLLHPRHFALAPYQFRCARDVSRVATRHAASLSGSVALALTEFEVCATVLYASGKFRHDPHVEVNGAHCEKWHAYCGTIPEFEHVHDGALPVESSDQVFEAHQCQELLALHMHDVILEPRRFGLDFSPEALFPVMRSPNGTVVRPDHDYWQGMVLERLKWALWASRSRTLFVDAPIPRKGVRGGFTGSSNKILRYPVIAPVIDWMNHGMDADEINCEARFDVGSRSINVVALRDIGAGEELLIEYLAPPSIGGQWWSWFLQYGFLPPAAEAHQ